MPKDTTLIMNRHTLPSSRFEAVSAYHQHDIEYKKKYKSTVKPCVTAANATTKTARYKQKCRHVEQVCLSLCIMPCCIRHGMMLYNKIRKIRIPPILSQHEERRAFYCFRASIIPLNQNI